jgi:hypothetical protein
MNRLETGPHHPAGWRPPTPAEAATSGRARVSNGKCVHVGGDPRGTAARRYRDIFSGLRDRLGHSPDAVEDVLLRTGASLALQSELLARELASGKRVATADLTALTSELRRVLIRLGLGGGRDEDPAPRLFDLLVEHGRSE